MPQLGPDMSGMYGFPLGPAPWVQAQQVQHLAAIQAFSVLHQQLMASRQQQATSTGGSYGFGQAPTSVHSGAVGSPGPTISGTFARLLARRFSALSRFDPDTIPSEGIRAGEVIAWRAWRIAPTSPPLLYSLTALARWIPGLPMQGDVRDGLGVFALKDRNEARALAEHQDEVWGEVALWGEIHEHELGYRAEFGAVRSLYARPRNRWLAKFCQRPVVRELCRTYNVPATVILEE